MFNRIAVITTAGVIVLAFYDAWASLGDPLIASKIALTIALILSGSHLVAFMLGRRTGCQLLLNTTHSIILVLALIAYARYAANAGGTRGMHFGFFPMALGVHFHGHGSQRCRLIHLAQAA